MSLKEEVQRLIEKHSFLKTVNFSGLYEVKLLDG